MVCSPKYTLLQREGIAFTICMMLWCNTRKMALWTWWHLLNFFCYSVIFYNPGPFSLHFTLYSIFSTSEIFGVHCLEDLLWQVSLFYSISNVLKFSPPRGKLIGIPCGGCHYRKKNKLKPCNTGNPNVFNQGWCCCACCAVKLLN